MARTQQDHKRCSHMACSGDARMTLLRPRHGAAPKASGKIRTQPGPSPRLSPDAWRRGAPRQRWPRFRPNGHDAPPVLVRHERAAWNRSASSVLERSKFDHQGARHAPIAITSQLGAPERPMRSHWRVCAAASRAESVTPFSHSGCMGKALPSDVFRPVRNARWRASEITVQDNWRRSCFGVPRTCRNPKTAVCRGSREAEGVTG